VIDLKTAIRFFEPTLTVKTSSPVDQVAASRLLMAVIRRSTTDAIAAQSPVLLQTLPAKSPRRSGLAAACCAAAVERGVNPALFAAPVVDRLTAVLRSVHRQFERDFWLYLDDYAQEAAPWARQQWGIDDDGGDLVEMLTSAGSRAEAIQSLDLWCLAATVCLSPSPDRRRELLTKSRRRLIEQLAVVHPAVAMLSRLTSVLDDELLLVLYARQNRAFEFRVSAISAIDQLQIILADVLADLLEEPQIRPAPWSIRAATAVTGARLTANMHLPWMIHQWPAVLTGGETAEYVSKFSVADTARPNTLWKWKGGRALMVGIEEWNRPYRFERDFNLMQPSCRLIRELSRNEAWIIIRQMTLEALKLARGEEILAE